jgi:NitT/TauT family transport system permease protein
LRRALTTVAQVGASLPAIALFPLIILILVRRFGGGMEVASILLLLTGMQWYILFNGLSGTSIIPGDLSEAARALGLSRMQTWKRLVLPAIRPALITGMITAWGGGWNALVVSEYVAYKDQVLTVNGIGALLNRAVYQLGDGRAIGLCLGAMVAWILILNTLIWRPLYQSAAERYKFEA